MMGYTPAGVRFLLIVTVMSFMVEIYAGENAIASLALWPLQAEFKPWQLFTYAFLHASTAHLAINMYGLWMFGSEMENLLGRRTFLWLYFASIFTAGLTQMLVMSSSGTVTPTVGASGGVFGLLLAYGMCFPKRIVMLLIPPIPLPARLFVFLYAGLELLLGVTGAQANVAHFAHLGGMIGGYLVIRRWRKRVRWY